ncbi:NlpC/P60 family protein [Barrientosiimonas marina]|uniref:NlpC/P60 family protein n=1 Tax=Lentibacillus kimchii TaxID=1542911 RepID=A0ABW2UQC4_9BACI
MKKFIGTAITAGALLVGSVSWTADVHAEQLQDVKNEQAQVQDNLSDTESDIANVMQKLDKLTDRIKSTSEAQDKNKQKMKETKAKISETEDDIDRINDDVSALKDKIAKRKKVLSDRLVSLQENGGDISYLQVIFGSKNFQDMINRLSAVSKIADSDKEMMERQETDKAELQENKDAKKEELSDLKDMKVEIKGMSETIEAQKEQNENDKEKLKKKKEHLNSMKNDLENKDESLAAVEKELTDHSNSSDVSGGTDNSNQSAASASSSKASSSDAGTSHTANQTSGSTVSSAIQAGYSQTGTPYVTAGKGPSGFDCSGFVSWAYGQAGVSLPSSTAALQSVGSKVSLSNAQRGDLVFFDTYKTNGHVGIYLGNNKFLGAQSSGGVGVANMNNSYWENHFKGHVRSVQ